MTIAEGLHSANVQALALAGLTNVFGLGVVARPKLTYPNNIGQSASADELTPKRGLVTRY